jgi:Zn-finger nucleic acid-binding protein
LAVPQERSRDAAVVRCGQCGAARRTGAKACDFCHADFTLHERDLHTICPGCCARISDRARYCHHCGIAIQPQASGGEASVRCCPACEATPALRHRTLGERGLALEECHACAGLWLPLSTFERLLEDARQVAGDGESVKSAAPRNAASQPVAPARYRSCPTCRALMHRQNFGRRSGVIVDRCRDCGVWFDAHELDAVLAWVRSGGERLVARQSEAEARPRRAPVVMAGSGGGATTMGGGWEVSAAGELIEALVRWLVR